MDRRTRKYNKRRAAEIVNTFNVALNLASAHFHSAQQVSFATISHT